MDSKYYIIFSLFLVFLLFGLLFFTTLDKNSIFIKYTLLAFPFMDITMIPSLGYPTIFNFTTILFTLFFYRKKNESNDLLSPYKIMLYIFVFILFIGLIKAENNTNETIASVLKYTSTIFLAKILIEECTFDINIFFVIISYIKLLLIGSLIFLIFQFIFGPYFSFEKILNDNIFDGPLIRYPGYFQDPQRFAQLLSAGFFISLIPSSNTGKVKRYDYILGILLIISILFTGSRAALLGMAIGAVIIVILGKPQYRIALIVTGLLLYFISPIFSGSIPLFNRDSTYSESSAFRFLIWIDALNIANTHPFFGIGVGNYASYVSIHNPDQFWVNSNEITIYDHPESGYLKFLTEFGYIGFFTFFSFIFLPIINGIKDYLKQSNIISLLLIASIVTWLFGFATVYSFADDKIVIIITIIVALLISFPHLKSVLK